MANYIHTILSFDASAGDVEVIKKFIESGYITHGQIMHKEAGNTHTLYFYGRGICMYCKETAECYQYKMNENQEEVACSTIKEEATKYRLTDVIRDIHQVISNDGNLEIDRLIITSDELMVVMGGQVFNVNDYK